MENIFVIDGTANSWEDAIRLCSDELIRKGAVKTTFREACLKREEPFLQPAHKSRGGDSPCGK